MTRIEELERVLAAEVELGEALLQLLMNKQRSIVGLQSEALSMLLAQEEQLLRPFQNLEAERVRLTAALVGAADHGTIPAGDPISVVELMEHLPATDSLRISTMATRLRTVVERILQMNGQNRVLLQRSLRFVQDTLRLVTEDHTRALVDHRA
ncbi:MAG: flagellar protein FlgN [Ignavibacteriae bacterium]|nr:flagellar protein FlgN [Ignavibacteriota bacterium]